MSQHCKFYRQKKQIYLNGYWIDTGEYRRGDFYEMNSFDCGYIAEDWRASGYTCVGTSKYQLEVKYISNNGMTWTATTDTRVGSLIESDSFDCGYIAEEWRNTGTMCYGLDKYYQQTKYITDNGTTWTATTDTRRGSLIESQSVDCLDPSLYKAVFYTFDENTHGVKDILVYPCDGNTVLNNIPEQDGSWGGNYELIKVGNCVTEIADDSFYLTGVFHLELPENGNLTRIGIRAFSNTSLGYHDTTYTVRIPDTVQIIDHQAFDCTHGTLYDIGTGCTYVGGAAFDRLKKCGVVNFNGLTPPDVQSGWTPCSIFKCYGGGWGTVTVPCGKYEEYMEALTKYDGSPGSLICDGWSVSETCTYNIIKANYSNGTNYRSEDCNGAITITTATTKPSGYQYTAMTSCELGSCVNGIGDGAFSGFTSLQSITKTPLYGHTPVSEIQNNAFLGCTSLTDVNSVTSAVTSIGNSAFSGCTSLSSITIADSIENIGNYAFKGCTALTGITIYSVPYTPETAQIISIGTGAFDNTNNCPIFVDCNYLYLYEASSSWAPYVNRLQAIPGTCFSGKFRGQYQYYDYTDLRTKEVECNSSTTLVSSEIENGYAMKLKYAEIGDCVTSIDGQFKEYIIRINSKIDGIANIPSGVTSIGNYAFSKCSGLTSVNLPNTITNIGEGAFQNCSGLTSIEIPSGITSISNYTFQYCSGLTSISLPSGVTSIGGSAFMACSSLTSINIPNGVTNIPRLCFTNCRSLTSITIPDSVTYIYGDSNGSTGYGAFMNCSSLSTVVIGSGITRIFDDGFYNCQNLSSVTIYANTPPTVGYYTFSYNGSNIIPNIKFYVPADKVDTYKNNSNWSRYSSRIYAIPT